MATILKNIVRFTGLAIGVPTSLPHLLNLDDVVALTPEWVAPNVGPFTVAVDATNVTVTRLATSPGDSVDVWVEWFYTPGRVFNPQANPPPQFPFILGLGSGGGGGGPGCYNVTGPFDNGNSPVTPAFGDLMQLDMTAGVVTVALPAIAAGDAGCPILIKNVSDDGADITLDPDGAETINGQDTIVIASAQASILLAHDGVSNWMIL